MFEIKQKDNKGRIGILKTQHGNIKTPALMPVIHPRKQTIDVKKFGAEIVITNAYLIYKEDNLREKAINEGIHSLIDFDGIVMTDSGSYQLSVYGDIDITNEEILEFQELIKTDIGTSLDIPTAPFSKRDKVEKDLKITLNRAKEAIDFKKNNDIKMLLNSVVQGSTFPDLRSSCAKELSKMDFDLYPIGAVVPLMENYKYADLVDVVMFSISNLPDSSPRHLMGGGHPMIFALSVAMGCDLFDSAAYILYAEDDRFLTPMGTYKLENLVEMPCSCNICNKYTPEDLRQMNKEERVPLIAEHNLNTSFAEIRLIRQAIADGNLMELVELRCRSHPMLLNAYRHLSKYSNDLENYDPRIKKSAFFYTGSESLNRAEIIRHLNKLNIMEKKKDLIILPSYKKPYSQNLPENLGDFYVYGEEKDIDLENSDFMVLDIPFGLIPLNIDEVYPLSQNESPKIKDSSSSKFIEDILLEFCENYQQTLISSKIIDELNMGLFRIHPQSKNIRFNKNDQKKIIAIADYQFGHGAGKALFDGKIEIEKSKKTGKIRHIFSHNELIANMRASDSYFVLASEGAKRLHRFMEYPSNRVVVNQDAEDYVKEGKSVFSKFVIECDKDIKANDEVLIVNEKDELLATGKTLLNYNEINNFNTGQAIKTRKIDI